MSCESLYRESDPMPPTQSRSSLSTNNSRSSIGLSPASCEGISVFLTETGPTRIASYGKGPER